jgi:hypothetical protein
MKSLLLALLALYPALAASQDKLKIEGIAPGEEVVVMLFGRTSAGCLNGTSDPARTTFSTTGELLLGNMLSKGRCRSHAVAVFSKKHAMKWQSLNWTDQPGDVRTIKLDPLIDAALNIWVTNDADRLLAEQHAQMAQKIFLDNRVGVRLVPKVQKLSDVPGAPSDAIQIVNSGLVDDNFLECSQLRAIRKQPFYVAKTLNVYYVGRPFTGRNCALKNLDFGECPTSAAGEFTRADANITFIGAQANPTTLAHELGHAYGLRPQSCGGHTSGPDFPDNMMSTDVSTGTGPRNRLTLGQVFRMNTHKDGWGGTMLIPNNIPKRVAQTCFPHQPPPGAGCPALEHPWP